jgi:hypothetical protein
MERAPGAARPKSPGSTGGGRKKIGKKGLTVFEKACILERLEKMKVNLNLGSTQERADF